MAFVKLPKQIPGIHYKAISEVVRDALFEAHRNGITFASISRVARISKQRLQTFRDARETPMQADELERIWMCLHPDRPWVPLSQRKYPKEKEGA